MKKILAVGGVALICSAIFAPAHAACYADYKAKKDAPLQLHYGVAEVGDGNCSRSDASQVLKARLSAQGWQLLNVLTTFGPEGLAERKASAGGYFLRF